MTDLEAKVYIAQVRNFYEDLMYYGGINIALIFIWLFFSTSWYFWPGWVIIGWGAVLLRRAFLLRLFSVNKLIHKVPLFSEDWEERQLKKLMEEEKHISSKREKKGK